MSHARQEAEDHRRRVICAKLARMGTGPRPGAAPLATGFPALDGALQGGFPRGAMSELFGPPSSGKTTLALHWVAHLQSCGLTAAWIDADHAFDPAYAAALGVATGDLPLARPDSAEQALEMVCQLTMSGAVDAVVIDSAAALTPQIELEGAMTGGAGLQSRVLASGLKRLARAVARSGAAVLFLNQTRSRMDPAAQGMETSAGGPSLKLYPAARLVLEPLDGRTVRFRTLKNKAAEAFREGVLRRGNRIGFSGTP
jgi:recombination protein RecA